MPKTDSIDLTPFLRLLDTLRVLHWRASRSGEHEALGAAYDEIEGKVDEFVECFLGSHAPAEWEWNDVKADPLPDGEDTLAAWERAFGEFEEAAAPLCTRGSLQSVMDDITAASDRLRYRLKMA